MKKSILLTAALFITVGVSAQGTVTPVVVSGNGGAAQNTGGGIEWTIGEPVSATYTSSGHITTMGFHQPVMAVVGLAENAKNGTMAVYPNPVQEQLKIDFTGMNPGVYNLKLTDALGKLISEKSFKNDDNSTLLNISMTGLAPGNYFLQIDADGFTRSVKITKVP